MSNSFDKHLRFARALRVPDEAAVKRQLEHFNAQNDVFTQCPKCKQALKGTVEQIKAHRCGTGS
jgi:hypothetical protein